MHRSACASFIAAIFLAQTTAWGFRAGEPTVQEIGTAAKSAAQQAEKPTPAQQQAIQRVGKQGWQVLAHPVSGRPLSVRGKDLEYTPGAPLPTASAPAAPSANRARGVLRNVAPLFLIHDAETDFSERATQREPEGYVHIRMAQMHRGLRVIGGEMTVHFDPAGRAYQVDGRYRPLEELTIAPKLSAEDAADRAKATLKRAPEPPSVAHSELVVWAMGDTPRLAYQIDLRAPAGRWRTWIDALNGSVLLSYDNLHHVSAPTSNGADATMTGSILSREGGGSVSVTGWRESNGTHYLYNKNRRWFVYNVASSGYGDNATYAFRNSAAWGTSDRAEMSAARNFDLTQQYFSTRHGRSSFDNAGIYARANVHQGINYVNAYWDGSDFHFGDGDGATSYALGVLDVAAHEFTHAVTEYTANLDYYGESGALNESFSDIFGACVEFFGQSDGRSLYPNVQAGAADWLMGEDCWISSKSLRDMRNPRNTSTVGSDGVQPSRYHGTYWYYGSGDNGGVHYNSGVQNFFFYLLCEGGSGNNDGISYNVAGIGVANAERVAYRALTVYCGPYTDYVGARAAWISAAQDLNSSWVPSVQAAWAAVGVSESTSSGDAWDPGDNSGAGATTLTMSTTEQQHGPHSLSANDSYDWYTCYLQSGQSYVFHTQGSSGDNYGELYSDSSGNNRVAYNDDGGGDLQFYLTYTPTVSGWYYLRVRAYSVGSSLQYNLRYRQTSGGNPGGTLADALDAAGLAWTTGGNQPWTGQSATTHDGVDAAQSGAIDHSQSSWFETTLQGPGTLSFWWRVSSEYGYDFQRFQVNGSDVYTRSGEAPWEQRQFNIPVGQHTVRWLYTKDGSVVSGSDRSWVDQVVWQSGGSGSARPFNDFDGDGRTDLTVFNPFGYLSWFILSMPTYDYLAWDIQWGFPGCYKVPGDYDGDGLADLAVYGNGRWYIRRVDGTVLAWNLQWGSADMIPVYGDYDGDGRADLAVFDRRTSRWYIRSLAGGISAYGLQWGFPGADLVPGDYDGDGRHDLAVRDIASSRWYIRSLSGGTLAWNLQWGFNNTATVPGDYDGDGRHDLAIYSRDTFRWFIRSLTGAVPLWNAQWGYGKTPAVPGDFDGDGRYDLAIRDPNNGQWFIRSVSGSVIAWSYYWGWNGEPVPRR